MTLHEARKTIMQILEDETVSMKDEYLEALRSAVMVMFEEEDYRRKVRSIMGYIRRNT